METPEQQQTEKPEQTIIEEVPEDIEYAEPVPETIEAPEEGAVSYDDLKEVIKNALTEYAEESTEDSTTELQLDDDAGRFEINSDSNGNEETRTDADTHSNQETMESDNTAGDTTVSITTDDIETAMYNAIVKASADGLIEVKQNENYQDSVQNIGLYCVFAVSLVVGWLVVYFGLWKDN